MNAVFRLLGCLVCASLFFQPVPVLAQSKIWMPVIVPGTEDAPSCPVGVEFEFEDTTVALDGTVQASQTFSTTYAFVIGLTAGESWLGLPSTGNLKFNGRSLGNFVKNIPGTLGSSILSKVGAFAGVAVLIAKICNTTSAQGIPADAVVFEGSAGYIPFTQHIPEFGYLTFHEDAVTASDNSEASNIVALILSGEANKGWIITRQPFLMGQQLHSMEAIQEAVPQLVAEKKFDNPSGEEVVRYFEEWLKLEKKETTDLVWVPDLNKECPKLPDIPFDYKARVLISSRLELMRLLQLPDTELSFAEKAVKGQFLDKAEANLPTASMVARYETPRPRNGSVPHHAHYTSLLGAGDVEGLDWNIELRCWWSEEIDDYFWNFRLGVGPLNHGLTGEYSGGEDFLSTPYQNLY